MAIIVEKAARGNAPATGMQKSKAPTRPAPPDAVSHVRAPTAQSYGENGGLNNMSRTNPGEFVQSDLAANLRASVDDPIGDRLRTRTLADAKADGTDVDLQSPQLRKVDSTSYPVSSNMKRQQMDLADIGRPSLPKGIDKSDAPSPASATQTPGRTR